MAQSLNGRYGEPWGRCPICGFDFPQSRLLMNKDHKMVDHECDDQLTHQDHLQRMPLDEEANRRIPDVPLATPEDD